MHVRELPLCAMSKIDEEQPEPAQPSESATTASSAPTPSSPPSPTPAPQQQQAKGASGERVFASPLARKLAERAAVALENVVGTGPRGRVTKADVEAYEGVILLLCRRGYGHVRVCVYECVCMSECECMSECV